MRTLIFLSVFVLMGPDALAQEESETIATARSEVSILQPLSLRAPALHLFLDPEIESTPSRRVPEVTRTADPIVPSVASSPSLGHPLSAPLTEFSLGEGRWVREGIRKPDIRNLAKPTCAARQGVVRYDFCPPADAPANMSEQPKLTDAFDISQRCAAGDRNDRNCKFHWGPALLQQTQYLMIETGWNLANNYWVRQATFHGKFFHDYWESVEGFRFSRWSDDNPFIDDYIGHPMMGSITMDIFIQNYPRGKSLEFQNTKEYWQSRLWALLWSAIYSAEWKLGPISEASIGNTGQGYYYDNDAGKYTNGTGTVGLVVTPLGGWVWNIGEDLLDLHIIRRIETKSSNRFYLFGIQILNPCRAFANLMRFKSPWYRDSRPVWPRNSVASGIGNP